MCAEKYKASGSQKRRRQKHWSIAMTEQEHAEAMAKVEASGLSKSSYGRKALLGKVGDRAQRRPTVEAVLFTHAIAELNKVGSNLNQIARVLNTYGLSDVANENFAALAETRAAVARLVALTEERKAARDH